MRHVPRAIVAASIAFVSVFAVPASMAARSARTTVDQIDTECNAIRSDDKYAWMQLCFRQADRTLERAKQTASSTIPPSQNK